MGPTKKDTSLDLCSRLTALGNTISIRMLEYLSTTKQPIHGFQSLATQFMDLSRDLWSIEAGLAEASKTRKQFPLEMTSELDRRFRQIDGEFLVLSQMMSKFLDNSKKSGFMKGFRMMFADTDVDKMRMTLSKSHDALQMSSAMFRWSLGDARVDSSIGIGYTGLAAALTRLTQGKDAPVLPIHTLSTPNIPADLPTPPPETALPPLPISAAGRSSSNLHPHADDTALTPIRSFDGPRPWRANSTKSSQPSVRATMYHGSGHGSGTYHHDSGYDENYTEGTGRSRTLMEEQTHDFDLDDSYPNEGVYRKDSQAIPQWAPRESAGSKAAGGKVALVSAIEHRNHKALDQLLNAGARADARVEAGMLRTAIQNRDLEGLHILLRHGADANGLDKEGFTPLLVATQVSFTEGAKLLLRQGADVNMSAGSEAESPLAAAAGENKIDLAQMYLKHGGDANLILESGCTTLIKAMNKTASPQLVELLLSAGADPNSKDGEGATALFTAIQANRIDLMAILLDHGADPNLPAPKHPLWPSTYKPKALQLLLARGANPKKAPGIMELASSLKKMESISILINAGVSPNIKKDGVYTPLCSAIRDNSADIVSYLLENGADPNLPASEYPAFKCLTHHRTHFLPQLVAAGVDLHTPKGIIEAAVANNEKDAMLYLLEQGVSPNDKTAQGHTALTTAIKENKIEFVDLLLKKGADPAIRGHDWPLCMAVKQPAILKKLLAKTPNPRAFRGVIEMAVVANQLESIQLLLHAGVSVEDKNCGVFSPLTTAIREDHKHIVRYLLDEAGADVNAPGEHLPLVKALRRYHDNDTEIIAMLLARGADINRMHRGWNPVLQAVENGDAQILRMLIEKGGPVDLQLQDESGRPVVDIVTERGWEEGMSLLFPNAGAKGSSSKVSAVGAGAGRQSTFRLSDWRWMSAAVDKGENKAVLVEANGDADDSRALSGQGRPRGDSGVLGR